MKEPSWDQHKAAAFLLRMCEPAHPLVSLATKEYGYQELASRVWNFDLEAPFLPLLTGHYHDQESAQPGLFTPDNHDHERSLALNMVNRDLELLGREDYSLLTPIDEGWPQWRFHRFDVAFYNNYGQLDISKDNAASGAFVQHISRRPVVAPIALWVRGLGSHDLNDLSNLVGVVGTRTPSQYGKLATQHCVHEIINQGAGILSGGAMGIDAIAHHTALASGGITCAVLAGGVDRPSPTAHSWLFDAITTTGLLISEYPPGAQPRKHRFLVRNRLIAALSSAVAVMEAPYKSGALNTAWWAEQLGVPVAALPSSIFETSGVGTNNLIKENKAILCVTAQDIMQLSVA